MPRFTHRLKNRGFIRGYQMQFWNTGSQPANLPATREAACPASAPSSSAR